MKKVPVIIPFLIEFISVLFLFCDRIYAQRDSVEIEHISVEQGLSNNQIHCVMTDSYGFLWIGTKDGLNRYDGFEFIVYRNNNSDSTTLSSPSINKIAEGRNGDLWIGTMNGLNHYRRNSDSFVRCLYDPENKFSLNEDDKISNILVDRDDSNYVWIGTYGDGLILFDTERKRFHGFGQNSNNLNYAFGKTITSLFQDSFGDFWIGTRGEGLKKINLNSIPRTGEGKYDVSELNKIVIKEYLNDRSKKQNTESVTVINIYEDKSGTVWVLLDDSNVLIYNRKTDKLEPVSRFIKNRNHFHDVIEDQSGTIWFGAHGKVLQLNPISGTEREYELNNDGVRSSSNQGLCRDRAGNIWAATWDGLFRIYRNNQQFEYYHHNINNPLLPASKSTYSILKDRSGRVWIGTSTGLLLMRKNADGSVKFINYFDDHNMEGGSVYALAEDHNGLIWGVVIHTLVRIDPEKGSIIKYKNHPDNSNSLAFQEKRNYNGTVNIFIDSKNNLWVSTFTGGISKASLNELYSTVDLKDVGFKNYFSSPEDPVSLINHFIKVKEGHIWICTQNGGIIDFDSRSESIKSFKQDIKNINSLSVNYTTAVYEDRKGIIWIGTYGGGLNRFDREKQSFTRYNISSGLPSDIIHGILEDENNNLWISSNGGITRFDPDNNKFRTYNITENKVCFKDKLTGKLYFADTRGFVVFNPDSIKENNIVPPVVITKFTRYANEDDNEPITDRTISAKKSIQLSYRDDIISLEFAALSFNTNLSYMYAYKMEGLNDSWINLGRKREITFTNIDPGNYNFQVKACNEDGIWCTQSASIKIFVSPPWWSTWWSYGIYGLLFLSALYGVRRFELNRKTEKEEMKILELENKRKTEELEQARKLQLSMLPKVIPSLSNLDIAVYMSTATEVGGDYYDFYLADNETLTAVVGDATGHGINAGMMVSVTKGLFQSLAYHSDLKYIISRINDSILSMKLQPMYMSIHFLRIVNNRLQVSGAGMPPILYYQNKLKNVIEIESSGPPLGGFPNYNYGVSNYELNPGDIIVMMSDGFAERRNPDKEMIGWQKGREILSECKNLPPDQVINAFNSYNKDWGKDSPQEDDITFVVIRVK